MCLFSTAYYFSYYSTNLNYVFDIEFQYCQFTCFVPPNKPNTCDVLMYYDVTEWYVVTVHCTAYKA